MLRKDEILNVWAPPESPWSHWVKPVLFAFADGVLAISAARSTTVRTGWVPAPGSSVIIVNLPGEDGVIGGIELARRGYRPIPLYNALPFPSSEKMLNPHERSTTTVDVVSILTAIYRETPNLQSASLSASSPPAFLLDADRRSALVEPVSGVFDNRSVCFETDFPSAEFLRTQGIGRVILVQRGSEIGYDLSAVLLAWQRSGIQVLLKVIYDSNSPRPIIVRRPSLLRRFWFRMNVALGFRRGELGAFGGIVPSASG